MELEAIGGGWGAVGVTTAPNNLEEKGYGKGKGGGAEEVVFV